MSEHRIHPRYACSQDVRAGFFQAQRRSGTREGVVLDISEGGLLLKFEEPLPPCDRIVVYVNGRSLSYELRHSYEQNGSFFAGVRLMK